MSGQLAVFAYKSQLPPDKPVVFHNRVLNKRYRQAFLDALLKCLVEVV